jgi:CubicO group peptidase (beta-lactamase class C family)
MPALRTRVATALADEGLTGATWALAIDGQIHADAAGIRDARNGQPLEASDRVQMGSVAKTLLATGILKLVSEGKLSLDATVDGLLPRLEFDNPWVKTDPVRVRHLLDHSAGLDDARIAQVFSLRVGADDPLMSSFTGRHSRLRVRNRPGARFSYSNTSYTLLGMIVEAVTGERYEPYLNRTLLRPLGMNDSTFGFVSQAGAEADARLAMGHFENRQAQAAVPLHLRPASQFTTTSADMGRFASFLMGDGTVAGRSFIDPELLRAMGRPHATEAAQAGLAAGYGLGLLTRDRHGVVGRCHSGNTVGYRAMFCLFDDRRRAFFVAINTDSETADYGRIDAEMIAALGITSAAPAVSNADSPDLSAWEGFYAPAPNRFASAAWFDRVFGFVTLRARDDGFVLQRFAGPATRLTFLRNGLLRAEGRTAASHVLLRSAEGEQVLSTGTQSFAQVSVSRLLLPWVSLVAGGLGAAWLLAWGIGRAIAWRLPPRHPLFAPFAGLAALLLPVPLLASQSFLELGDVTPGSALLAIVTALLPLALLTGLLLHLRARRTGAVAAADALAMVALLQLLIVLAFAGLVPLRLYAV